MKKDYINDLRKKENIGNIVEVLGWIKGIRDHKDYLFLDIEDSTGTIQVEMNSHNNCKELKLEQSVMISGNLTYDEKRAFTVIAERIEVLGDVKLNLSPTARQTFNCFSENYANNVIKNKHLYIRNSRIRDTLKARSLVIENIREWFRLNGYFDVTAPILTPILLYDDSTGIQVHTKDEKVFLTQCVGFYLESAVHSLEKVYNIGPSFRGAESVSKRHLMEYWHIKSELAFCSFDEYFSVVESLIANIISLTKERGSNLAENVGTFFCSDGIGIPFPRIEYKDALEVLRKNGIHIRFGCSINYAAEKFLSEYFNQPFWITHKPRSIEGFPYKINRNDERLTETADLIASKGYGEILGIAEKITDVDELKLRLIEKGKDIDKYRWFCELREYGTVPHCGLGMGLERLIRWLFMMNHVRDVIPFPRSMNRPIYP